MNKNNIEIGDWVSFVRSGMIIISQVMYVKNSKSYSSHRFDITTLNGIISETDVLEIRKAEHNKKNEVPF